MSQIKQTVLARKDYLEWVKKVQGKKKPVVVVIGLESCRVVMMIYAPQLKD